MEVLALNLGRDVLPDAMHQTENEAVHLPVILKLPVGQSLDFQGFRGAEPEPEPPGLPHPRIECGRKSRGGFRIKSLGERVHHVLGPGLQHGFE